MATYKRFEDLPIWQEARVNGEFRQYLFIAKGSCGETRSQIYRAYDSGFLVGTTFEELKNQSVEISQSISNFIDYLQNTDIKGLRYKNPGQPKS